MWLLHHEFHIFHMILGLKDRSLLAGAGEIYIGCDDRLPRWREPDIFVAGAHCLIISVIVE